MKNLKKILVTGGAGYVGAVLVPKLLAAGYEVKVIDLYIYGDSLSAVNDHPHLTQIKGDIRDWELLNREIPGSDAIIHLACISNDPSFELNPELGKSINFDAFAPMVETARRSEVKRFIYASSSSVYGVKDEPEVTEDLPLKPLTDYSLYKAKCEEVLLKGDNNGMAATVIRPATVCGYSPRLRLDLTVNILTNLAVNRGEITVFGGAQKRPNIHIVDMTDLYLFLLEQHPEKIRGKVYNAGYQNHRVAEIADLVNRALGGGIKIATTPTDDNRSYHVSSEKIRRELGFEPEHSIEEAVIDLHDAFKSGLVPDSMTDIRYYNIKTMQALNLH